MAEIILFIKDFELGARLSSACVDLNHQIKFTDEKSDPLTFSPEIKLAIVDMDEEVFSSVGLISELKRRHLSVIGTMKKLNNRDRSKLQTAGCDIIITRSALIKSISRLISELID